MKKNERVLAFVQSLEGATPPTGALPEWNPHYLGYFTCFNAGQYYEAHDVLEHLWLRGCGDEYAFYKGLIQIAGAFVHLRKQYERPQHPKDGKRLRPAVRLFRLGISNVAPYGPEHLGLNVTDLCARCRQWVEEIEGADYTLNPWHPERLPHLAPVLLL